MTSIETKYISASNKLGARIQVKAANGMIRYFKYPIELDGSDVHDVCLKQFCKELNWTGKWYRGDIKHGGYVYVFRQRNDENVVEV